MLCLFKLLHILMHALPFFNALYHLLYVVNTYTSLKILPKSHILCEASLIISEDNFQSAPYIPI